MAIPFIVVWAAGRCGGRRHRRRSYQNPNMPRDTTIRVSQAERDDVEEAAYQLCGTNEVPYGKVVSLLIENAPDVDV